jgi:O-antigen/teichoic acid export membrane protein
VNQEPEETRPAPAAPGPAHDHQDGAVSDAGAVRNTLLQLASQIATLVFTAGLTLYLVRALGAAGYGVYALAASIAGLVLYPAGLGLPMAIGRFLADHRSSAHQLREIFKLGLRVQLPAAALAGLGLFAASGAIADAYGDPRLGWPLRWVALSVLGQAMFAFLTSVGSSVRRASLGLWMTVIESAAETSASIALVVGGAGVAGAALGKFIGYSIATVAGVYLAIRLLGRSRPDAAEPRLVSLRALTRYAGAMLVVDVAWSAITQVDVLLIGALLSSAAVGSFGAVLRVLAVLGYLGMAVSSGVAPRLSLADGAPDVRSFQHALRYLIIVQGVAIAPMLVWARPIVDLLLGSGYRNSVPIMRVLTLYYFVLAPASLITVTVTYLGEARRRVPVMAGTLIIGAVATYVLIRAIGVVGAAVADDIMQLVYVSAHLWICSTLITLDLRRLMWCGIRTVAAAGAMALVLFAFGTAHLTLLQWLGGGVGGGCAFGAALLLTHELSVAELQTIAGKLWAGASGRR